MMSSLSCTAKANIDSTAISEQFSYVCGQDAAACAGIVANATTGIYGAYSMCTAQQKLSFAFNQYYILQKKASTACDFGGLAQTQTASTASECAALVSAAGTAGTATVTAVPTAASAVGTGSSSGSASSASSSAAAVGSVVIPRFQAGLLSLGAYVTVAVMAGAGMVLL
jgi:1,3-beta-glucanosyltransferase GAS1